MKKNYNQPEFVVVEMMPQTIICASNTGIGGGGNSEDIPGGGAPIGD